MFIGQVSLAQPSGYMGKRFMVIYEPGMAPTFFNPNKNNKLWRPSFNHALAVEYVVARSASIGIQTEIHQTGANISGAGLKPSYYNSLEQSNYNYGSPTGEKAFMKLSSTNYQFFYKRYKNNNVAPLGTYFKFGVFIERSKSRGLDVRDANAYSSNNNSSGNYYSSNNDYIVLPTINQKSFVNGGLFFTWGRENIFYDKLIVNYGVRLGYTFGTLLLIEDVANSNRVAYDVRKRMTAYNLLNFNLGIGYLIF